MENIIAGILAVTGLAEIYLLIFLIASPRRRGRIRFLRRLERLNVFLALFFVMTLGAFFLLNGQAYADNIAFDLKTAFGGTDQVPTDPIFTFPTSSPLNAGLGTDVRNAPTVPVPPQGSSLELVIPKIGVKTPIIFPTDLTTPGILKSLEGGVGVYPGSVMPGQTGHMIMLGHSSRASWYHGDYAHVFSLLDQLAVGDEFMIVSGNTKYVYRIFANQVFKPAAEDIYLAQPAQGSQVDLSTCDPVGTAANRRIVSATLIASGQ